MGIVQRAGQPIQYVDGQDQPVAYLDAVGQPVQYVDEQGHPIEYVQEFAPSQSLQLVPAQPNVFSCSPEIFAKLAQGGTLTPEELHSLTGAAPLAPSPELDASAEAGKPLSSSTGKSKSKKKSLS